MLRLVVRNRIANDPLGKAPRRHKTCMYSLDFPSEETRGQISTLVNTEAIEAAVRERGWRFGDYATGFLVEPTATTNRPDAFFDEVDEIVRRCDPDPASLVFVDLPHSPSVQQFTVASRLSLTVTYQSYRWFLGVLGWYGSLWWVLDTDGASRAFHKSPHFEVDYQLGGVNSFVVMPSAGAGYWAPGSSMLRQQGEQVAQVAMNLLRVHKGGVKEFVVGDC